MFKEALMTQILLTCHDHVGLVVERLLKAAGSNELTRAHLEKREFGVAIMSSWDYRLI
jgi:hypothetical protein